MGGGEVKEDFQDQDGVPAEYHIARPHHWMPKDHRMHRQWLNGVIDEADGRDSALHPVLEDFKKLIEGNTRIYLLFSSMFEQIPRKKQYRSDPYGQRQVRDYKHMLKIVNHLIASPPYWSKYSHKHGIVGLPINAVLDWPMGTPSGFAAFLDPEVNQMWRRILDTWGEYLTSEASARCLDEGEGYSWLGKDGLTNLEYVGNLGKTKHNFHELFVCDPNAKHYGFKSWDDFFTRKFREYVRPLAHPDDDNVIANACESAPYKTATNVKARDRFWIKGQPYSVCDMLAHDELAYEFVGGTIYQAFLSALSYHCWHAPVSGIVKKAFVVPGTYYSEPLFEGVGETGKSDIDEANQTESQGYITATATRAIIFFEADNKDIGLMAFIGVGMAEVSTCDIQVTEGQHVKKGDEIGMFHFGGSTHCLLFRKGVKVKGFPKPGHTEVNVPVKSQVAIVSK